jgi:hypothetical protein
MTLFVDKGDRTCMAVACPGRQGSHLAVGNVVPHAAVNAARPAWKEAGQHFGRKKIVTAPHALYDIARVRGVQTPYRLSLRTIPDCSSANLKQSVKQLINWIDLFASRYLPQQGGDLHASDPDVRITKRQFGEGCLHYHMKMAMVWS